MLKSSKFFFDDQSNLHALSLIGIQLFLGAWLKNLTEHLVLVLLKASAHQSNIFLYKSFAQAWTVILLELIIDFAGKSLLG